MSVVSEKAIYTGWIAVGDGEKVSIIDKQYTDFNTDDFKTYSTDDSKFRNGILISTDLSIPGGYGGIVEYKVKLDSGEEITFRTSPREYYFKVVAKSSGGKKSRRKRNSKKSRKNRRKSTRRHN